MVPDFGQDCFGACCSAISGAVEVATAAEALAVVDSVGAVAGLVDLAVAALVVEERVAVGSFE